MKKKPTHRWLDTQVVIGTLAMTMSLGLWRLFAVPPPHVSAGAAPTAVNPTPLSAMPSSPSPTVAATLSPVRILLGGAAPRPPSDTGGSGPVTVTGSSQP